jgi:hypothetical protein
MIMICNLIMVRTYKWVYEWFSFQSLAVYCKVHAIETALFKMWK